MIDYKYLTIASGATPIGSAGRAPDEEFLQEKRRRKFRVHCRWQTLENKLNISLSSGERIQEPDDFGHSICQTSYMKSKISRSRRLKKSKFAEVED
jgi:hypothetical protein